MQGSSILACYLDYGHLFLVREDETGIDAVRYHRSMLPYGTGPAPVHGKPIYSSSRLPIAPFASIGLSPGFSNSYGIVAVSARAAPDAIQRPYAMFYTMHTTPDDIGAELRQAPPAQLAAPVQCVEGTGEALTSVRPTCAVYVLESEPFARHTRLQIVRYLGKDDVDTEHIVVLDQEDTGIESGDITSITSDDYMGVIYLTTVDGTLFVIRFA